MSSDCTVIKHRISFSRHFPVLWAKQKLYIMSEEQEELLNIVPSLPSLITLGPNPAGTCTGLTLCELFLWLDRKLKSHYIKKTFCFLRFGSPICQLPILSLLIKNSWVKISFFHSSQECFGVGFKTSKCPNESDPVIFAIDDLASSPNIIS